MEKDSDRERIPKKALWLTLGTICVGSAFNDPLVVSAGFMSGGYWMLRYGVRVANSIERWMDSFSPQEAGFELSPEVSEYLKTYDAISPEDSDILLATAEAIVNNPDKLI
ncbi:MAG TPA: hypothetical protein VMR34_02450 [Candidatus Saccharimonadales bacterium]|nr:hypothetical protein [Candidatus Saccharimonadales bacterium]